ncbi:DUF5074 domain-containing protein [Arundinibacter roseus]|uniref:DUF5074 domain-containing protein n=1 Tax=Arundinibacter roseus TaxID=2070510 RepID=A0A4R4KQH9_9BACT|nr:DUF5074 domain-containing protein [Arundinibacter roseus]TDB68859.1 DUF5074 domain-containing protein [Arundinibacter roseus]
MKQQFLKVVAGVCVVVGMNACREKTPDPEVYEQGVMVLNAGNFLDNNGSISFFRREQSEAQNDLFFQENGRSLTGNVQSMAEVGAYSLILVDNSTAGQDKVEIVNVGTFKSEATLSAPDIENPRYVVRINDTKAYVSCWDATGDFSDFFKNQGYIAVVDLTTQTVTKKIPVPKGAERMVKIGNEVYLGAVGGTENLTVLDAATDQVKRIIKIGASPDPIDVDANGKLWIQSNYNVVRINPLTDAIEANVRVGNHALKTPSNFAITPDRRSFYFLYSFYDPAANYAQKGEIYRFGIDDTTIRTDTPFLRRVVSGLGVDPAQGLIYGGVTPSFKQAGYVVRYRTDASVVDSIKVDISPSGFVFK